MGRGCGEGARWARARARARLKGSAQPILFHSPGVGFRDSLETAVNARWQMPQAPRAGCTHRAVAGHGLCGVSRGRPTASVREETRAGAATLEVGAGCWGRHLHHDHQMQVESSRYRQATCSSHAARVAQIGMLACARARPLVARSRPAPRAARRAARCAGSRQGKKAEVRSKSFWCGAQCVYLGVAVSSSVHQCVYLGVAVSSSMLAAAPL